MLLTITTSHQPANDLGFLLHKHPQRFQSFDLSFGKAHVYYPEVSDERCSACLLLDVDSVGMVRGKNADQSYLLAQYVNDRPYTASSFMSVALSQVFGSALQGRCKDRPELTATALPLTARIDGRISVAVSAVPAVSPPPPHGTTIVATSARSWRISSATVPCPATTSASSKGRTIKNSRSVPSASAKPARSRS